MLKNIAPKGTAESVRKARQLRAEMSLPEVLLWQELRKKPNGIKFRRQHPSGLLTSTSFAATRAWRSKLTAKRILEATGQPGTDDATGGS